MNHFNASQRKAWARSGREARVANGQRKPTPWNPGEMRDLIDKAVTDGKVTKCQPADVSAKTVFGFDEIK